MRLTGQETVSSRPMRVVLDTNTIVSGLFWGGHPRQVLELARSGQITLFTASALLDELFDVLSRPKFAERLRIVEASPESVVEDYAALAEMVIVTEVIPVIAEDPDDDQVIACAIAAHADYIVSGDRHLLALAVYNSIQILNATQFMLLFK